MGAKRSLVLTAVPEANLEGCSPPLPANTSSTVTLNANDSNLMLCFGVRSSLFGTPWMKAKWWCGDKGEISTGLGMTLQISLQNRSRMYSVD